MSDLLPIFPLPNVVLFPNVFLPLHIFEPRYREMVADAVKSDRLIGMALLRPGWEQNYEGHPPVYPVGCSGVITHVDQLQDGRYNIVLRGVERFRIREEDHGLSYRRAVVDSLPDWQQGPDDKIIIRNQRARLESLLATTIERSTHGLRQIIRSPSVRDTIRRFRRPCRTRISSTRWRNISIWSHSNGRRSSKRATCARGPSHSSSCSR